MGLRKFFSDLVSRDAQPRAYYKVPKANELSHFPSGVKAQADQHYFRIWISELFLEEDKKWFTSRYPLAYSLAGLTFGDQTLDIANVSGRNKFAIEQPNLGQSILRNYPLTPLLPFKGGTVELDCGLVSLQASNEIQSFAKVVSDISATLNVPQVSSVIGIASTVTSGIQDLLGAGKAETVLYLHDTFAADRLVSGHYFASSKKANDVDPKHIFATKNGLKFGKSKSKLANLDAQDFLALRIEVTAQRDDFQSLSYISKPLDKAYIQNAQGNKEQAKIFLNQAIAAIFESPDLTMTDKKRIVPGIRAQFQSPSPVVVTKANENKLPNLIEFAANEYSVEKAISLPELSFGDISDFSAQVIV